MRQVCGDKELRKRLREEFPGFELEMLATEVAEIFNVSSIINIVSTNGLTNIILQTMKNRKINKIYELYFNTRNIVIKQINIDI